MSNLPIFDIAGSALQAQSVRMSTIASNLSNADTVAGSADAVYKPLEPIFQAVTSKNDPNITSVKVKEITQSEAAPIKRYEPGHPLADADGYIYQPDVDPVAQMVNLISTSRNYQAGVEMLTTARNWPWPPDHGPLRPAAPDTAMTTAVNNQTSQDVYSALGLNAPTATPRKEEHAGPGRLPAPDDRAAAAPGSAEADGQHADGRADGADVHRAGHHRSEQDGEGLPGVDGQRPGAAWRCAGHQVLVPSEKLVLEKEGNVEGTVAAPSAGIITVDITDANGAKVTSLSVEAKAAGETAFQWDGKDANGKRMEPGKYSIVANHVDTAGKSTKLSTYVQAPVESVTVGSDGLYLNLKGLGTAPIDRAPRQLSRTFRINQEHPMGFNVSLSGINAANTDLSVTANNVANVNTTGFKQSRAEFADLFASTSYGLSKNQTGSGVRFQRRPAVHPGPQRADRAQPGHGHFR